MTKRTNAAIADGLMHDAKRYDTLRRLAVMNRTVQDQILAKLGEPEIGVTQDFDDWVDGLIAFLYGPEPRVRRTTVPDED